MNVCNAGAAFYAQNHIRNFWGQKSKVPLVEGFNKGIENSKVMVQQLGNIWLAWGVSTVLTLVALFSSST